MTELCNTCLGCQQMEDESFNGVLRCQAWRDGREQEGQMRMEDNHEKDRLHTSHDCERNG